MQPYFREVTLDALLASILTRWKLIATITLAALIAGAIYALAWPATYDASAVMAEMTSNSTVQLDQGLKTQPDTASSLRERNADAQAHQQLMITLIDSREVARQVSSQLADQLAPDQANAARLRKHVDISSNAGTGLYQITARDSDPRRAARIANAWAKAAQAYVTQQMTLETSTRLDALSAPTRQMLQRYKAAQQALEAFLVHSPRVRLTREIAQQRDLAQRFHEAQRLLNEVRALASQAASAQSANAAPSRLPLLLLEVQAFDRQFAAAPWATPSPVADASAQSSTSTAQPAQAPAPTAALPPIQLQISSADRGKGQPTTLNIQARARSLMALLDARLQRLSQQADAIWQDLGLNDASNSKNERSASDAQNMASIKPPADSASDAPTAIERTGNRIDAALTRLQWLQEKADAKARELSQLRDAAWDSYVSMQRIQAAANVPGGVETTRLWTVSGAAVPDHPNQSLSAALAWSGVIGLGLGILIAFLLESARTPAPDKQNL